MTNTNTKPSATAIRLYEIAHGMRPGALLADDNGAEGTWGPNTRHRDDAEAVEAIDAEIAPVVDALEWCVAFMQEAVAEGVLNRDEIDDAGYLAEAAKVLASVKGGVR